MAENIPQCIGFVIDGNRRWAREREMNTLEGHKAGLDRVDECVRWVRTRGMAHAAFFVFSTENWKRTEEEVGYLMRLFEEMAKKWLSRVAEEGVRLRFVGKLDMLPEHLRASIRELEEKSAHHTELTVWTCISYGGRAEITAAARAVGEAHEEVTEESLRAHMWSAEMPDPDIIVRTGGEKRLSNFLLWQAAYSELFFLEPYWPDFSEKLLDEVLAEYAERERRHGK